jgi:hypothetical protein
MVTAFLTFWKLTILEQFDNNEGSFRKKLSGKELLA